MLPFALQRSQAAGSALCIPSAKPPGWLGTQSKKREIESALGKHKPSVFKSWEEA